jgi:hypothetical protein
MEGLCNHLKNEGLSQFLVVTTNLMTKDWQQAKEID